jgi:hypothetical protein
MDRRLSGAPSGTAQRDLLNWSNSWMKSIALERHFLLTFCCCRQKVSRAKGISCEKRHADAARDASKRQRIKSVATKTKKTSLSSFSSNPKESLKPFQKKEMTGHI